MDEAIDNFIKGIHGNTVIVTGWVLLAGTAENASQGFTMVRSEGMPTYTQLGLLESGLQALDHGALIEVLDDRAKGANPPF
jgi:hypothetical protein